VTVTVFAGWFVMGSDSGPASSQPTHWVYLGAYVVDTTEVTVTPARTYLQQSGVSLTIGSGFGPPDHPAWPALGMLRTEARDYSRWHGARLPTEAEWEKAARGTDGRAYPWGDIRDATRSNTSEASFGHPLPVGSFPDGVRPYGLYDVAGNVAEWVEDHFDPVYYTSAPAASPTGPTDVLDHRLRGGSWASAERPVLTYFRDSSHSARPNLRVGFRCARSAPDSGKSPPAASNSLPRAGRLRDGRQRASARSGQRARNGPQVRD
jgi:formylglycine-generating enzyme required for sulfatase activity